MTTAPATGLVDTHAHLHFDVYRGTLDGVLQRATEVGVNRMITVGVNAGDSRVAVELAAAHAQLWAAVGIHPHDADAAAGHLGEIRELAAHSKVVAIGECGLDYYKSTTTSNEQKAALRGQIELARELDLPLIFHVREAFADFLAVLRDHSGVRGVVHSFTGSAAEAEQVLAAGLHIAANGIITFTKSDELPEVLRQVPPDRLLLETDCPFLSPAPDRGQTNQPARVRDVAVFMAQLRGESLEDLIARTSANAGGLFKLQSA